MSGNNDNNRANNLLQVVDRVRELCVQKSGGESSSSSSTSSPPHSQNSSSPTSIKRRVDHEDNEPNSPQSMDEGGEDCQPLDFSSKKIKKENSTSSEDVADDEASPDHRPPSFSRQFQFGEQPQFLGNHSQQQPQPPIRQVAQVQPQQAIPAHLLGSDGNSDPHSDRSSSNNNSPNRRTSPELDNSSNLETSPEQDAFRRAIAAAAANGVGYPNSPLSSNPYQLNLLHAAFQQRVLDAQNNGQQGMGQSCGMQAGRAPGLSTGASPALAVQSAAGAQSAGSGTNGPLAVSAATAAAAAAAANLSGDSLLELSQVNNASQAKFIQFRETMMEQIEASRSKTKRNSSGNSDSNSKYKDSAYLERRKKNNEAAKRSRDARRTKENEIAVRAQFLERENNELKIQLANLRAELIRMREKNLRQ